MTKAEKKKEYLKKYYKTNKDRLNEQSKDYNLKNKNKISKNKKEYLSKNRDIINFKKRIYYLKNKAKIIKRDVDRKKIRKENNPKYRLKVSLRDNIRHSFKRGRFIKDTATENILGCTIDDFRIHISEQFTEGMTLKNHGKWHLDHIIPLATATTKQDIIDLCHYTNYQPLWAADNLAKGCSII